MCSVNQIHGQIKLLEMWKAVNVEKNPIKVKKSTNSKDSAKTRSGGNERLVEIGKSGLCSRTFINDAIKLWNNAPSDLKDCKTLYSAKKAIKKFSKSLPI